MPLYSIEGTLVLHIHAPKTGGTTIHAALEEYCVGLFDTQFKSVRLDGGLRCSPQHFHGPLLASVLDLSKLGYIFMISRHPLSRLISEYKWRRRHSELKGGFEEWVSRALRRAAADPYAFDNHLRPMTEYVVDGAEFWKFENGLDPIYNRLNELFPSLNLRGGHHRNVGSDESIGDISPATLALIEQTYATDFEMFGYAKPISA
jgi:hypothetical protein